MSGWTAIVPIKAVEERKTRLGNILSAAGRATLSARLFAHVTNILAEHGAISAVIVLASHRPEGWAGPCLADEGRGLNDELESARRLLEDEDIIILHADLPLLESADIDALIEAGEWHGIAIAPDRHGTGTNALALKSGMHMAFQFGANSFQLHQRQMPGGVVIKRSGLAIDLDTPDDLLMAKQEGFTLDM